MDGIKNVVLVGSSGGGAATLGHADVDCLRASISQQLAHIGESAGSKVHLSAVMFVACDRPLDFAKESTPSRLWVLGSDSRLRVHFEGGLAEVNVQARRLDAEIAAQIRNAEVDGVIAISSNPLGINKETLTAAGALQLPVVGTGGSSLSVAACELGCRLIGNSGGSVATTPQSKAIGVAAAFASEWRLTYTPGSVATVASVHSVLDGCLPAFLAGSCAATAVGKLESLSSCALFKPYLGSVGHALRHRILPPALGAIAAQQSAQASGLGEIAVLGGALIGSLSQESALCALLAGNALGRLAPQLLAQCARFSVPATASTIAVAGGAPTVIGLLAHALAPIVGQASDLTRRAIVKAMGVAAPTPLLRGVGGGLVGLLMNFGSRRGWYHGVFLPLILVEMEHGEMSILGALDWLTLCMTGAGVCAAQLVVARRGSGSSDRALAKRGLFFNVAFGDYIEACFPFLERDPVLNAAVYAASAGSAVLACGARSTAYLPMLAAVLLGDAPQRLVTAAAFAFFVPFATGVLSNAFH